MTRNRQSRQSYTVWEPRFRNGLCRTGQYFVGRPASRRVTEQYEHPVYDLQPQHIKVSFLRFLQVVYRFHYIWIGMCSSQPFANHQIEACLGCHHNSALETFSFHLRSLHYYNASSLSTLLQ